MNHEAMSAHTVGVVSAAGAQGVAIARALEARGATVRRLVRKPAEGSGDVQLDLADADQAQKAFDGLSAVCLTIPLVYDPELTRAYAENVASAASRSGLEHIVYNTNTRLPAGPTWTPAFETRRVVEDLLGQGTVPVSVVRPTIYLDNLLNPAIVAGLRDGVLAYPLPERTRVAWTSLQDLGAAAADAVAAGPASHLVEIGGQELTGQQLADELAGSIGRELRYVGIDPVDFERGLARAIGEESARGVAGLYHWIAAHPETMAMAASGLALPGDHTTVRDWSDAWLAPLYHRD